MVWEPKNFIGAKGSFNKLFCKWPSDPEQKTLSHKYLQSEDGLQAAALPQGNWC